MLDLAAVTFQLVLTKADGVKPAALERKLTEALGLARAHPRRIGRRRDEQRDGRRHRGTPGAAIAALAAYRFCSTGGPPSHLEHIRSEACLVEYVMIG